MALASITAMDMPLVDLQLSANTLIVVELESELGGFGAGWFFTTLLQHGAGAEGGGFSVPSMVRARSD